MKEHSKKQREKRKASLIQLERVAKLLSDEHVERMTSSEQMFEYTKTKRNTFACNLNLCLDFLFGDGYNSADCNNRLEIALVEDVSVKLPVVAIPKPDYCTRLEDETIVLKGLDQFTAFASRMDGFCHAIARLGENVIPRVSFKASIDTDCHVIHEFRSHSAFRIESLNATLTGGKKEMKSNGAVNASFNEHFQIVSLEIIFDVFSYQRELNECFGKSLVRRACGYDIENLLAQERTALEQRSSSAWSSDQISCISTAWDSFPASLNLKLFGVVIGKSNKLYSYNSGAEQAMLAAGLNLRGDVIANMSNDDSIAVKKLSRWRMQSKVYQLKLRDNSGNVCCVGDRRNRSTFIQAVPYGGISTLNHNSVATHIVFVSYQCNTSSNPLYYTLIKQLIHRCIEKYTPSLQLEGENLSCSELLQKHRCEKSQPNTLHYMLTKLNDILRNDENFTVVLKSFLSFYRSIERRFLKADKWIDRHEESISSKSASTVTNSSTKFYTDDAFSLLGLDMDELPALTDDENVPIAIAGDNHSELLPPPTPLVDVDHLSDLFEDVNAFFMQVRNSDISNTLIESLVGGSDKTEQELIEQFLWLCWSKHSNRRIQKLMKFASILLLQKDFQHACEVLDAVIEIDSTYAEAYYKRATVHFGLRKAHDCFSDIDWVLTLQPYHYGALYAKAMMLMKLGSYQPALYTFERAIMINPLLSSGNAGMNIRACKTALQSQQSQGDVAMSAKEQSTSSAMSS